MGYKKIGALYIYTTFWMELSNIFMSSSKIFGQMGKTENISNYTKLWMRRSGISSSVIFALTMIYSRIFLFSKVMIPIIQHYYRNKNNYIGSIASIAFLISGYYKTGDGFIKTFIEK